MWMVNNGPNMLLPVQWILCIRICWTNRNQICVLNQLFRIHGLHNLMAMDHFPHLNTIFLRKLWQTLFKTFKIVQCDQHTLRDQLITVYILLISLNINFELISIGFLASVGFTFHHSSRAKWLLCGWQSEQNKWHQRIICASLSNNQVIIWHSIILIRHFCKCGRNQLNLITNCGIPFVLIKHCLKSKTNFLRVHTISLSRTLTNSVFYFRFAYIFCIFLFHASICLQNAFRLQSR